MFHELKQKKEQNIKYMNKLILCFNSPFLILLVLVLLQLALLIYIFNLILKELKIKQTIQVIF